MLWVSTLFHSIGISQTIACHIAHQEYTVTSSICYLYHWLDAVCNTMLLTTNTHNGINNIQMLIALLPSLTTHTDLTVSGHVTFHAAVGRKHHVTQTTDVFLHTGVSSDVRLQYTAWHERLEALDTQVRFLTCKTNQPCTHLCHCSSPSYSNTYKCGSFFFFLCGMHH